MVSEINRWTVTTKRVYTCFSGQENKVQSTNTNAVFEINPGHFKRPFQEPRHGTDSSLALPDQYLPTFLR